MERSWGNDWVRWDVGAWFGEEGKEVKKWDDPVTERYVSEPERS